MDGLNLISLIIPTFDHLILPSDNVFGLDRVHFPLGEVGEQFGADDMLLGVPSVLFQPVLHIGCVGVDKAIKSACTLWSCSRSQARASRLVGKPRFVD